MSLRSDRPAYLKKFGQHHLVSGDLCRPLLEFLEPAGRAVVEIGPGAGVLTAELARVGAQVLALEVDVAWAFSLQRRALSGVSVVVCDATRFLWSTLTEPTLATGNLPFNVATALIDRWLNAAIALPSRLPRAAFMVQKEVGQRLRARPGDEAYGALSVLTAARAQVEWLGMVAPGSFRPPPKVAGAFLGFVPHLEPVVDDFARLRRLVHLAFGQRRKTLRRALANGFPRTEIEAACVAAGIRPEKRAEELALGDFLALDAAFFQISPKPKMV